LRTVLKSSATSFAGSSTASGTTFNPGASAPDHAWAIRRLRRRRCALRADRRGDRESGR